jgi:hypothetical protein
MLTMSSFSLVVEKSSPFVSMSELRERLERYVTSA